MKKYFAFVTILLILSAGVASINANTSTEITTNFIGSIPIGSGNGKINYKQIGTDIIEGPISFAISNSDDIYVLDDVDKQVEIFNCKAEYINTIDLISDDAYYDIEIRHNKNIVLLTYKGELLEYNNKGTLVNNTSLGIQEKYINMTQLMKDKENKIILRNFLKGTDYYIDSKEIRTIYDSVQIKRTKEKEMNVTTDGMNIDLLYDYGIGNTYPITYTNNNELILLKTDVCMDSKIDLKQTIIKINLKNGKKEYVEIEPSDDVYYFLQPFYVTKSGRVFCVNCKQDIINIKELKFLKDRIINTKKEDVTSPINLTNYTTTSDFDFLRHYNAYGRGVEMAEYEWEYNPSTMKTASTSTTQPPDHLVNVSQITTETGIPYKWGGKTGLDTADFGISWSMQNNFIDEINDGDTAGDINSSSVVASTAGIDCGGFIIAAFELPYERSCTMIKSGNYEFEDGYWHTGYGGSSYGAGSIGVCSFHVFMAVVGYEGINGELLGLETLESTTSGYGDKVKSYSRTATDIDNNGYVPMQLKEGY